MEAVREWGGSYLDQKADKSVIGKDAWKGGLREMKEPSAPKPGVGEFQAL